MVDSLEALRETYTSERHVMEAISAMDSISKRGSWLRSEQDGPKKPTRSSFEPLVHRAIAAASMAPTTRLSSAIFVVSLPKRQGTGPPKWRRTSQGRSVTLGTVGAL